MSHFLTSKSFKIRQYFVVERDIGLAGESFTEIKKKVNITFFSCKLFPEEYKQRLEQYK
jgi:hypothetical protein